MLHALRCEDWCALARAAEREDGRLDLSHSAFRDTGPRVIAAGLAVFTSGVDGGDYWITKRGRTEVAARAARREDAIDREWHSYAVKSDEWRAAFRRWKLAGEP